MLGVIVNTLTVLLGSTVGLLLKKKIPERITSPIMIGLGLCTLYIGFSGSLSGKNVLVLIISMVIGSAIGTLIDIDKLLGKCASAIEKKFGAKGQGNIAGGFVAGSLLFCVGSMTITGSIQSGISGDDSVIFAKAALDLVSSAILAATFGGGVMLSAVFVFLYQGALVLAASVAAPLLSDFVIAEMTCVGSVTIIALGLNIIGIGKIKVANYLPAIFMPIAICPLFDLIGSLL